MENRSVLINLLDVKPSVNQAFRAEIGRPFSPRKSDAPFGSFVLHVEMCLQMSQPIPPRTPFKKQKVSLSLISELGF